MRLFRPVLTVFVFIVIGAGLSACATPPPIPWHADSGYVQYALDHIPKPEFNEMCVAISVASARDKKIVVMNADYPYDRWTKLEFVPRKVLQRTIQAMEAQWGLMRDKSSQSKGCLQVAVSIAHVSHVFSAMGPFTDSPAFWIKLSWTFPRVKSGKMISGGAAAGYNVEFSSRTDLSTIKDYNRTAYVALIRAVLNGLIRLGVVDDKLHCPRPCVAPNGWSR